MSGVIPVAACIVCALVYRFSQNLDLNLTLSVVRNLSHIISCLTLVSGYFTRCIMTSLLHKFTHTLKEVAEEFSNEIDNAKIERQKEAVVAGGMRLKNIIANRHVSHNQFSNLCFFNAFTTVQIQIGRNRVINKLSHYN